MPTIRFQIEYATTWGESLWLSYSLHGQTQQALQLHTENGHTWQGHLEVAPYETLTYAYRVCDEKGRCLRHLNDGCFRATAGKENTQLCQCDHWPEREIPQVFRHSAFTHCIFGNSGTEPLSSESNDAPHYLLRLRCLPPPRGQRWAVLGSSASLGSWQVGDLQLLRRTGTYEWSLNLEREDFLNGAEYKFLLCSEKHPAKSPIWEEGGNRTIAPIALEANESAVVNDGCPNIEIQAWRGAGVVIPVFSLRSEGSQGIGDFGDLSTFVRWAASVNFHAVQLLPINDTTSSGTWHDSYPYSGISVFALHPIYLDIRQWSDLPLYKQYEAEAARLNAAERLDYEAVFSLKMHFLNDLFHIIGKRVQAKSDYVEFVDSNEEWLRPYARFMIDKARHIRVLMAEDNGTDFFYFVQFLLHEQMQAAHDVAREKCVILKGDIPIGVCRDSVPVAVDRQLFHLNGQAGAPPDGFARYGQNWGFPTYDWDEMARDGYAWWRKRLAHMANYFDAYRIDHVLGFFRIWEIPTNQLHGLLGHFRPALPYSAQELKDFGFTTNPENFTHPFITFTRMGELKRQYPQATWENYFTKDEAAGRCYLHKDFESQVFIRDTVADETVREVLMTTACEVLFIIDSETGGYHPRIAAQETLIFKTVLDNQQREAFNRIHDDFFYSRHNDFWAQQAMKKLPTILGGEKTMNKPSMLPCAEDLGMVPTSVKGVLERLNVLSLEIQRMPKNYGVRFSQLADNPYLSVATVETHDMPPIRLWWKESREQTQHFWREALRHDGDAPATATPAVCQQIIEEHLASPSMLCLISLQDYLAIDEALCNPHYEEEQINVPANPNQYWCYRMHITIEQLLGATDFNERLRVLVARSGR